MPDPSAGKTFVHKHIAKRVPVSRDDPELSAVTVLIPIRQGFQDDGALIEQIVQAGGCTFPEVSFIGTPGRMGLGSVNIRHSDFLPLDPEGVAIYNAVPTAAGIAIAERQGFIGSARLVSFRGICSSNVQDFAHTA